MAASGATTKARRARFQSLANMIEEQAQEDEALLDEVAHGRPDGLLDAVDVVRQPGHEVARRGPVEVGRRLEEDVAVEPVAHVLDDLVAHGLHEERREEGEEPLPEDDDDERR